MECDYTNIELTRIRDSKIIPVKMTQNSICKIVAFHISKVDAMSIVYNKTEGKGMRTIKRNIERSQKYRAILLTGSLNYRPQQCI